MECCSRSRSANQSLRSAAAGATLFALLRAHHLVLNRLAIHACKCYVLSDRMRNVACGQALRRHSAAAAACHVAASAAWLPAGAASTVLDIPRVLPPVHLMLLRAAGMHLRIAGQQHCSAGVGLQLISTLLMLLTTQRLVVAAPLVPLLLLAMLLLLAGAPQRQQLQQPAVPASLHLLLLLMRMRRGQWRCRCLHFGLEGMVRVGGRLAEQGNRHPSKDEGKGGGV